MARASQQPRAGHSSALVPFVGLTGGLGSGKTTALEALARLGAAVLSSDAVVHELYEEPDVISAVVERWGPDLLVDGRIDRDAVAAHAFADPAERAWLESLLWPRVGAYVARWRADADAAQPPPPAAVVETPLLFEAGMDQAFDATIAVVADEPTRGERARARGHHAVDERDARQLPQDEKARRATFVVDNSGTVDELEQKLSEVLATLTRR
jgi:dephospho-CoA kinase